ncbi:MAG: sulfide/dihydroorotate dehydrogenase-like FAD/NAD-binding protein [Clostridia bacterium]|nr:sulfide/dihydroorotate dehydrogenase-like FAD/NAD-binding protein [Clostridia bacterium]MDR3644697.1 sulfide/dihydroorotate dehydrogenase-like FAD/NAD-binding protein [Clostridia bacterium]
MFKIVKAKTLCENVKLLEIEAPFIARKAEPGQFIILRIDAHGERVPFTLAGYDRAHGTVTIIIQEVGKTSMQLGSLQEGDFLLDVAGPLGTASELEGIKRAAVIGGGLGCAIAYPQAKKLHELGAQVDIVAGFKTRSLVILEEEMRACCDRLFVCTDDGSYGENGFVTNTLKRLLEDDVKSGAAPYDTVIAIGPLPMMKFVSALTKPYGIKTIVSMNPIMIDGTGMCGGCRVRVGGETKFACVDGPDFDGHQIDFDDAMRRLAIYKTQETRARERYCRLLNETERGDLNA